MSEGMVVELGRQALQVAMLAALPMLLASLVMGILISILQVATSLQDATLTFVPKILAVGLALLIAGAWILRTLLDFTHRLFSSLPGVVG